LIRAAASTQTFGGSLQLGGLQLARVEHWIEEGESYGRFIQTLIQGDELFTGGNDEKRD
jgi:hypothetical protein